RFRVPVNGSLLQSFMVADHSLHSMALNSVQVCRQQYIFDGITFFLTESEFSKNIMTKLTQYLVTPFYISHFIPPVVILILYFGITNSRKNYTTLIPANQPFLQS